MISQTIPTDRFVEVRKLPIVVRAMRADMNMLIATLEGTMRANKGDIIIEGVNGERYPCKPDIFDKTYERIDSP